MDNNTLKKLQETELGILEFIHGFCEKHDISYSLYAGTAIGAIRHKGFIPWDDDIDIYMERTEYEKFKKCWNNENPHGYFFQDPDISDEPINHAKIRKDGTQFISAIGEENSVHNGIWVDIFIYDKLKNTKFAKTYMRFWGAIRVSFKRPYPATKNGKVIYFLTNLSTKLPIKFRAFMVQTASKKILKYNHLTSDYALIKYDSFEGLKKILTREMVEGYTYTEFCGKRFMINIGYDDMLRFYYGDYMQLPPKEEQICKHNPKEIIFSE